MILVRLVFQAKFGKGGELAASFKAAEPALMGMTKGRNYRLLTDLSGSYDTVVQQMEYESIQAFLDDMERMFADPRMRDSAMQGADLIQGGYKEYYTIE